MKEKFASKRFKPATMALIGVCSEILDEYQAEGYDLTLRQLYYQLVSRDIIPNKHEWYVRLGGIVNNARLAGLLDWDMIVDRGRTTVKNSHWRHPGDILSVLEQSFGINKWASQPCHVEVMCEKQALEGVLKPICAKLDVSFSSNKGYASQSFIYKKGKELAEHAENGKAIHLLYLGDH